MCRYNISVFYYNTIAEVKNVAKVFFSFTGLLTRSSYEVLDEGAFLRWVDRFNAIAKLLYYGLTTMSGLQTLGEEYTNLIQVHT